MTFVRSIPAVLLTVAAAVAPACASGGSSSDDGALRVEVSVYPLADAAQKIGGDAAEVRTLTPAGAEPHDMELTAAHVDRIEDADVILYIGEGFQPAVEKAVERTDAVTIDVLAGLDGTLRHENAVDPHFWLDPVVFMQVVDRLENAFVDARPADKDQFVERADAYRTALGELDEAFAGRLAACPRRTIVAAHDAFGYLAARYDLEVVAIAGLEPESEPNAERLAELTDVIKSKGVTTVFYETLTSPDVAEALAREANVKAAVLDPIEGDPSGGGAEGDYFSAMRANLAALGNALGCP